MVYTSSLGACIAACASTTGCVDVSWVGASSSSPCYMKNVIQAPQLNSGIWGARLLSSTSSTTVPASSTSVKSAVKASATPSPTAASGTGCGRALPGGQTAGGNSVTVSFTQSDGTLRSYLIHIPATYSSSSKTPLIYSFHGASSTGANQEGLTGFSQASNNPNAIVVYPNGINVSLHSKRPTLSNNLINYRVTGKELLILLQA